jgi:electron-transferring-flavoprotein dehydrogenase
MQPENIQRDMIEVDVLCVGAGVASLATALTLLRKCAAAGTAKPTVMVIEKGAAIGAHSLSGSVLDPAALTNLLTAEELATMPVESRVAGETMARLSATGHSKVPWAPSEMQAHGFPIISLSKFTTWLGGLAEAAGAEIYPDMPGAELLFEGERVAGVRLRDKGWDKHGQKRAHFDAGADIRAKVVVLGEGACGFLTEKLKAQKQLAKGANPQAYAIGLKELFDVPAAPDRVGQIIHTFGYPLDSGTYGGGFLYRLGATRVAVGLVIALDYAPAEINTHDLFRAFKAHPLIARELEGGEVCGYGAKVLPEGGFFALSELATDGALIVGEAAGLLDSVRLKGIHLAVQSGVCAGETLAGCMQQNDFSAAALQGYPARFQQTQGWKDLHKIRNARAAFKFGMLPGVAATGLSLVTKGLLPPGRIHRDPDHAALKKLGAGTQPPAPPRANSSKQQLDLLTDLFHSGTKHEEDQPAHLHILRPDDCKQCIKDFGAPCTRFCPAQVYEREEHEQCIRIQASNCLHCKTCQIKDPLQNIEWVPPEGGGGPAYREM